MRLQRGPAEGQVDAVFWRELQRRPTERRLRVQDAAVRLDFRGAVPHGRIRKKRRMQGVQDLLARAGATRGAAPAVGRGQRAGPPHALREDAVRRPPPYITVGEGRHGAVMHEEQSPEVALDRVVLRFWWRRQRRGYSRALHASA